MGDLKIWRPAELGSLELHVGTSFQHPYPRHWHEEFFITAITGGAGHFEFRGSQHVARRGTLVLVAPQEVHAHHDCDGGRSFRSMHLSASFLEGVTAEVAPRSGFIADFPSRLITDASLFGRFLTLHRVLESSETRLRRESVTLGFFDDLIRRVGGRGLPRLEAGRETPAVRRALDFLDAHYNREISLKDLASVANLSTFHFHRVFCREVGMPPHAYQIQLRVLRAKTLVRQQCSLADVASMTGFCDQSHLTRHFRRLVGIPPSRYAAHSKNIQDAVESPL